MTGAIENFPPAIGSAIRMSKTRISHPATRADEGASALAGSDPARSRPVPSGRSVPSLIGQSVAGAARPSVVRPCRDGAVPGERGAAPHASASRAVRSSTGAVLPAGASGKETRRRGGMARAIGAGMRFTRAARVLVALAALLWTAGAVASGASSQRQVNPGGGTAADGSDGLRWQLGSNSQFQVYLGGSGQVYNPPSTPTSGSLFNSVYLRVDRGTDATTRLYNNSNYGSDLHANAKLLFTQVSQTAISGSGTTASPWQVTTILRPSEAVDSGITVTIVDRYVSPESWLTRRVTLSGMPTSGASIKFYQHVDTYLQGGDQGPGFARTSAWNTTGRPDIVGVIKGQQFQALWYEPSSGTPHWDRYSSEQFTFPIWQMCRGVNTFNADPCTTGTGNLSNTINPNTGQDHGMAAQWNIPAGASTYTVEYRITFAMNPVDLTKSFAPATISAGGTSTLTFNLSNRSTNPVATVNFTDALPAEIQVASTPNIRTNCPAGGTPGSSLPSGMTVTAAPGGNAIQVAGASVDGAASASSQRVCQVMVDVTSSTVGVHHNTNANIGGLSNIVNLVGDETLTVIAQPNFGTCDARMFLDTTVFGSPNVTTLQTVNTGSNPFAYPAIGAGTVPYDALGYNPQDNYLYGITYTSGGVGNHLVRIGSDGSTVDLGLLTLSTGGTMPAYNFAGGAFSPTGEYYISTRNNNTLYRVNLTTRVATPVVTHQVFSTIIDFAFVGSDLYAPIGQLLGLARVNVGNGSVTTIGITTAVGGTPSAWATPNGMFLTLSGTGQLRQWDLATGTSIIVGTGPATSDADGASCPTATLTLPTDLSVTKTNTPASGPSDLSDDLYVTGQARTYTIVVTAAGNQFGVTNATVSDPVPAGIDAGTVSWTCTSTSGGAVCGAASGTGALNDTGLDLPAGAVATYQVTMTVPAGFTGDLTNTVTVTPPATMNDVNLANNTAQDVDQQQMADMAVVKSANPGTATPGTVVEYTVVVTNHGPHPMTGAVLADAPDAGLDCTQPGTPATCSATAGSTCPSSPIALASLQGTGVTLPLVAANGSLTFTYSCTVTATGF